MASGFQGAGYWQNGKWIDLPQTNLNSVPDLDSPDVLTATSERPPDFAMPGPAPSGNLPAVRINTPNSSTGTPFRLSPSAVSAEPAPTAPRGQLTPQSWGPNAGAPAPGVPTYNRLPIPGALGTAVGALSAIPTPTPAQMEQRLNSPLTLTDIWHSLTGQPATATAPATQTQQGAKTPIPPAPIDPYGPTPPPPPGVPFRGPVPAYLPQHGPQRAPYIQQGPRGGGGGGGGSPAIDPSAVDLGHYRQTVGNARTPTWVPGGMDAPAPQIFRGPTTMQGASNYGGGGPGSQNYYQPGSAPMAPGDWTGTGAVAGPLAAQSNAANLPSVAAQPMAGRGGAPSGGFGAPNAAMMNNAALGDQIMGGNTFAGGGGRTPMPPPRPSPGGFGYNPLSFFGAGP